MGQKVPLRVSEIGKRYGMWTIVSFSHTDKYFEPRMICKCDCGTEKLLGLRSLTRGSSSSCGCLGKKLPKESSIGRKYGRWIVEGFSHYVETQAFMICVCICGNRGCCSLKNLRNGKSTSCGCFRAEPKREGDIPAALRVFRKYQMHNRHPGNITFEQFYELSKMPCHWCGREPKNIRKPGRKNKDKSQRKSGIPFIYNGLDRLDSTKGHDYENCVPCCRRCNWSKNDGTIDEFLSMIREVYQRHLAG